MALWRWDCHPEFENVVPHSGAVLGQHEWCNFRSWSWSRAPFPPALAAMKLTIRCQFHDLYFCGHLVKSRTQHWTFAWPIKRSILPMVLSYLLKGCSTRLLRAMGTWLYCFWVRSQNWEQHSHDDVLHSGQLINWLISRAEYSQSWGQSTSSWLCSGFIFLSPCCSPQAEVEDKRF